MKNKGSRGGVIGGTVTLHYESATSVSPGNTAHGSKFNEKINRAQIDLGKDAKDADHYIKPRFLYRHDATEGTKGRSEWETG